MLTDDFDRSGPSDAPELPPDVWQALGGAPVAEFEAKRTAFAARVKADAGKTRPRMRMSHGRAVDLRWVLGATLALLAMYGVRQWNNGSHIAPSDGTTYATRVRQTAAVTLRDGTHITLAPQSKLAIAADFGRASRVVTLTGEAAFTVPTAAGAPFVVHTGAITTRVLGTSFTVRRYASDAAAVVMVNAGKVSTGGVMSHMIVAAGTAARVTDSSATTMAMSDPGQYTDWARGRLVFQRTPVPTLLTTLGRWYGYQFQLADSSMRASDVSAVFKIADPADMLVVLKVALDVTLEFHGNVVTLIPRRGISHVPVRQNVFTTSMEMGK